MIGYSAQEVRVVRVPVRVESVRRSPLTCGDPGGPGGPGTSTTTRGGSVPGEGRGPEKKKLEAPGPPDHPDHLLGYAVREPGGGRPLDHVVVSRV